MASFENLWADFAAASCKHIKPSRLVEKNIKAINDDEQHKLAIWPKQHVTKLAPSKHELYDNAGKEWSSTARLLKKYLSHLALD
jgi:hypothetical protein